jgi:hypothetical protein
MGKKPGRELPRLFKIFCQLTNECCLSSRVGFFFRNENNKMRKSRAGITLRFVHLCAVAAAAAFFIEIIPANNGISLISSFVCSVFFFFYCRRNSRGTKKKKKKKNTKIYIRKMMSFPF